MVSFHHLEQIETVRMYYLKLCSVVFAKMFNDLVLKFKCIKPLEGHLQGYNYEHVM